MTLTVYRGTHQIGGCATEIRTKKSRILIDFGAALSTAHGAEADTLPIPGVSEGAADCDAVFFTHYHGDHIGLVHHIFPSIPLYMGATAIEIFNAYQRRMGKSPCMHLLPLAPARPVVVGDITVTPLLVDHSAFDAYMFLIEGEGKRLLHTGDFRLHGFRGSKTIPMLHKYVGQVDWLICEGTALGRTERPFSERDLQHKARDIMGEHKRVFVLCASTNIDRIAAFYHARPDTRPAVCDFYQYDMMKIVERIHGEKTRLYRFPYLYPYRQDNQRLLGLMEERGFLAFIRQGTFAESLLARYGSDCVIVYSMWHGYLEGHAKNLDLVTFLRDRPVLELHSSGHAGREDLSALCRAVAPRQGMIPIHSEAPELLQSCLPAHFHTVCLSDGETFHL